VHRQTTRKEQSIVFVLQRHEASLAAFWSDTEVFEFVGIVVCRHWNTVYKRTVGLKTLQSNQVLAGAGYAVYWCLLSAGHFFEKTVQDIFVVDSRRLNWLLLLLSTCNLLMSCRTDSSSLVLCRSTYSFLGYKAWQS
jgi:hypothetical protein